MIQTDKNIYGLLANALEYPTSEIAVQAEACSSSLSIVGSQAQRYFNGFKEFCWIYPLSRLEELYTDTFDLQAICCPYVGFHLFGDDRARGMFMVKLKEHCYRAGSYPVNGELPDHISVMLQYLSIVVRGDDTRELINSCLIPAVKKMIPLFKNSENPYQGVLQATLKVLETERERL
jgi:nitrate reductase molybdenum cofactor assembly chaperone NarJ/NarW